MEINELRQAWQKLDHQLSQQNALHLFRLKDMHLDKAHSSLRPLFWGMAFQVAFGLLSVLAAAPFWISHLSSPVLWVSGLVVHIYGVLAMVLGGRIMLKIDRLDMSAPVVGIQKQVLDLKKSYIRSGWIVGLPWWVLWLPYTIMVSHKRYGLFSDQLPSAFIVIGVICTVFMVATLWGIHWSMNTASPARAAKMDAWLSGVSLTRAQQALDELLRFEHEEHVERVD